MIIDRRLRYFIRPDTDTADPITCQHAIFMILQCVWFQFVFRMSFVGLHKKKQSSQIGGYTCASNTKELAGTSMIAKRNSLKEPWPPKYERVI
jgi:hypothetical protein